MDELISNNSKLIYSIARKFYNVEREDLYQAGIVGLIKAYKNYKECDGNFTSYAYKYIFGEMYDLSVKSHNIKLNKEYLKLYKLINQARICLTQKLNKEVSLKDISEYLGEDLSLIEYVVYITQEMSSLDDEYSNIQVGVYDDVDEKLYFEELLDNLDPLSSAVLNYRVMNDMTQSEVASVLGLSQVKVSRIEAKSKQKILEYIS